MHTVYTVLFPWLQIALKQKQCNCNRVAKLTIFKIQTEFQTKFTTALMLELDSVSYSRPQRVVVTSIAAKATDLARWSFVFFDLSYNKKCSMVQIFARIPARPLEDVSCFSDARSCVCHPLIYTCFVFQHSYLWRRFLM